LRDAIRVHCLLIAADIRQGPVQLTEMYAGRQKPAMDLRYLPLLDGCHNRGKRRRNTMIAKILSGALLAGYMLAVSAPIVAVAADAPKTKADCKKAKDMKWDKTTKACVKK
jgi:hypothetical protein